MKITIKVVHENQADPNNELARLLGWLDKRCERASERAASAELEPDGCKIEARLYRDEEQRWSKAARWLAEIIERIRHD